MFTKLTSMLFAIPLIVAAGCAPQTSSDATDAPSVDDDSIETRDWAYTWGTWRVYPFGQTTSYDGNVTNAYFGVGFTDSSYSGQTRGGGACLVNRMWGRTCYSGADSECGTNTRTNPQAPWHYCWNYQCYQRPATTAPETSQGKYCSLNPARTATSYSYATPDAASGFRPSHVLVCMTKTAGPNTSCGGDDTSLYVRDVGPYVHEDCVSHPDTMYQCSYN